MGARNRGTKKLGTKNLDARNPGAKKLGAKNLEARILRARNLGKVNWIPGSFGPVSLSSRT